MNNWILLTYKLPGEPSARRVYVWRRLKRLGAITIFDAIWILPDTPRTYEQFQWLAAEIIEMEGEAIFWKAHLEMVGQEAALIEQFSKQVDEVYQSLLEKLACLDYVPQQLSQEYQNVRQRDYFQSPTGQKVRAALLAHRRGKEE